MSNPSVAATMTLNTAGFANPLNAARSALGAALGPLRAFKVGLGAILGTSISVGAGLAGLKQAFDFGSELNELGARTGAAVKDLVVLQQAFKAAGLGAASVGPMINLMQKALTGVNEEGQPTAKVFEKLGLSIQQLRGMSASQQLAAIGEKIRAIQNPAERARAAMEIFGRSGGQMLALLSDKGALADAATSVGNQAALLQKNSAMFDRISDILNSAGVKLRGFFVGVADRVGPVLLPLLEKFNKLDLSKLGQQVGDIFVVLANAFSEGKLEKLLALSLKVGGMEGINFLYKGFQALITYIWEGLKDSFKILASGEFWTAIIDVALAAFGILGAGIVDAFKSPLAWIQAAFEEMIETILVKLGKITGVKIQGFEEDTGTVADKHKAIMEKGGPSILGTRVGDMKAAANQQFNDASASVGALMEKSSELMMARINKTIAAFSNAKGPLDASGVQKELTTLITDLVKLRSGPQSQAAAAGGGPAAEASRMITRPNADADRLAKVGLFVGGMTRDPGVVMERVEKILQKIEQSTKETAAKIGGRTDMSALPA